MELMESFYNEQKEMSSWNLLATIFLLKRYYACEDFIFTPFYDANSRIFLFWSLFSHLLRLSLNFQVDIFLIKSETKFVWYVLDF